MRVLSFVAGLTAVLLSAATAIAFEMTNTASVGPRSTNAIEVNVPAKYKMKAYKTQVKDDKNDWTTDPQVIGWGWWTENKGEFTPEGGFKIKLGYYNESGDRVRQIRVIAEVE